MKTNQVLAEEIWIAIIRDLTDRMGIRQAWFEIDLEILQEIADINIASIKELLDSNRTIIELEEDDE